MKKKIVLIFLMLPFYVSIFCLNVVVTAPNLAEMIATLGETKSIIGRTQECDYPEEMNTIPVIGSFGNVQFEAILKLDPDLVITTGLEQDKLTQDLEKIGISTKKMYVKKIEDIFKSMKELGVILNKEEIAQTWIQKSKEELDKVSVQGDKKVFFEIYGDPIMTVSTETFIAELVQLAGGVNAFEALPRAYCRISSEDIINNNPEYIIATYPNVSKEQIKNRMGWNEMIAVKQNQVYTLDDINPDLILRPGPRFIEGIKEIKRVINEKK